MNKLFKITIFFTSLIAIMLSLFNLYGENNRHSFKPKSGFVPNEETAVKVAEVILIPIYGEEIIQNQKPLKAKLDENGIWEIRGTIPEGMIGGTVVVRIRKSDCKVIFMIHEK